jgi:uncharacterized protein YjbI with pentapeptide repeats
MVINRFRFWSLNALRRQIRGGLDLVGTKMTISFDRVFKMVMRLPLVAFTLNFPEFAYSHSASPAGASSSNAAAAAPSYLVDTLRPHLSELVIAGTLVLLVWTLLPFVITSYIYKKKGSVDKAAVADRYRGMITKIIAVPIVIVPIITYLDGYFKSRADDLERRQKELAQLGADVDARFDDRFRKYAELISSNAVVTQVLGIQGLERLISRPESSSSEKQTIVRALAGSLSTIKPRNECFYQKSVHLAIQTIMDMVVQHHDTDWAISISDACLRGIRLRHNAVLSHADFSNSDLSGSDLYKVKLIESNLRFSNLSGTNFVGGDFSNSGMYCTIARKSRNLVVASVSNVAGTNTNFIDGIFEKSTINYSAIDDSLFVGAIFKGALIRNTCFQGSDFYNARFGDTMIDNADFSNSNMVSVNFQSGSRISNSIFKGANLSGSLFEGSINNVSFENANLTDVRFNTIELKNSKFAGAIMCRTAFPDGSIRMDNCKNTWKLRASAAPSKCSRRIDQYCSNSSIVGKARRS